MINYKKGAGGANHVKKGLEQYRMTFEGCQERPTGVGISVNTIQDDNFKGSTNYLSH